jgi:formylglycine-generating enzyme required for sulfatase activity
VVNGLLDPAGLDVRAAEEVWKDRLPEHVRALRRFFATLEDYLLADGIWGPLLGRYQECRFRPEVQHALQARNLDLSSRELVTRVSAHLSGSGAIAMSGGTAAGAGGVAVGGNVSQIVLQQIIVQRGVRADSGTLQQRYLTRLRNLCCELPLAALGGDVEPRKTITLDQVYIELNSMVNVPESVLWKIQRGEFSVWSQLKEQLSERQHEQFTVGDLKGQRPGGCSESMRPLPALDALRLSPRLVLLGDPGAGESAFVRIVIARLLEGTPPPGVPADLLPVLLVLRNLAQRLVTIDLASLPGARHDQALADAVRDQMIAGLAALDSSGFTEDLVEALNANRCLLVFDGLDEVPQEWRSLVRRAVMAALQRYSPPHVIVTCRWRSYVGEAILPDFDDFRLAPFDDGQITTFAHAWYNAQKDLGRVDALQADHKAMDLADVALTPALRELASNPMLMTTMAIIHQQETHLPTERVRLYDKAVDLLLYRWQREKVEEDALAQFLWDGRRLRQVIERLAFEAHLARRDSLPKAAADLPRHRARDILEELLGDANQARDFLDYVDQRAGLLIGRGNAPGSPALYSFPHRTFQEYLAGCYLLTGRDSDRVDAFYARAAEGDRWSLAAQLGAEELLYNTRNGEQQLLYLAYNLLLDRPTTEREQRAVLWSGQMAELVVGKLIDGKMTGPNRGPAYLERLLPQLVKLLSGDLTAIERCQAGDILGHLGDPRFRADAWYLPNEPLLGLVEIPAVPFVMGSDKRRDRDADDEEMPQHTLTLPRYFIGRYPVTVAQFQAFVEDSGEQPEDAECLRGLPNHPVVNVTWYEVLKYCNWLTERLREWPSTPEQLATVLQQEDWRVSLPSEAEWEKAARGADGRIYPWGDELDLNRANYNDTNIGTTSAVGCFPGGASPYGIQDMSGNVWEWTQSLWGRNVGKPDYGYPYEANDGRENLQASRDILRVLRRGASH